ncbi:hypothetical protein CVV38_01365 [Candidatus Peregrinibacteria bacterium HGW-Peregrinibacteria-1]|jgi:SOS response regulatory protein OraA/RecX|nr:MAG: hypothetical protein CVV38_01365 [Candidatus Peregrinibacteria bacterium HGW-Peregrinibacteria-1]
MESYNKMLDYALVLATAKRYSCAQMEKKLMKFCDLNLDGNYELIDKLMKRLQELAYIDDYQYCKDFISDRVKFKPRGKLLLRQELLCKGINIDIVEGVLDDVMIDEVEMGEELLNKRTQNWTKYPEIKQKERALRYLSSKGFTRETIYTLLERCYR